MGKNPSAALLFAVMTPGLGQFYNGDFKRGLLILFLFAAACPFAVPTGFLSTFAVWLWGLINAYNVAARRTALWT
jgi:TM2 domain-containing membrane protein YozV